MAELYRLKTKTEQMVDELKTPFPARQNVAKAVNALEAEPGTPSTPVPLS